MHRAREQIVKCPPCRVSSRIPSISPNACTIARFSFLSVALRVSFSLFVDFSAFSTEEEPSREKSKFCVSDSPIVTRLYLFVAI